MYSWSAWSLWISCALAPSSVHLSRKKIIICDLNPHPLSVCHPNLFHSRRYVQPFAKERKCISYWEANIFKNLFRLRAWGKAFIEMETAQSHHICRGHLEGNPHLELEPHQKCWYPAGSCKSAECCGTWVAGIILCQTFFVKHQSWKMPDHTSNWNYQTPEPQLYRKSL